MITELSTVERQAGTAVAVVPTASPGAVPVRRLAAGGEYLSFRIGEEEYGIDTLKVQEIRSYEEPTRIAGSMPFLKGVLNLRGVIVPIIDLRLKLGAAEVRFDPFTVSIILSVQGRMVGVIVDSVSDVVQLKAQDILPAPSLQGSGAAEFIIGMAPLSQGGGASADGPGDRLLILADVERLLSSSDLGLIDGLCS